MKEDDIMVTRQDLNRIIVEKVKQNNHDMRKLLLLFKVEKSFKRMVKLQLKSQINHSAILIKLKMILLQPDYA